ncbi:uncharacterized protein LOC117068505 [Trachypithecus francoisi]|uniref:uncharacterized protein LOC117068505 n=1 Tax=Trachypithecus francoisi TaxID=54180 RepID=UPI00141B3650|nr:uncharacterized protein LOC117068505 [Trachypithecus francoisi]
MLWASGTSGSRCLVVPSCKPQNCFLQGPGVFGRHCLLLPLLLCDRQNRSHLEATFFPIDKLTSLHAYPSELPCRQWQPSSSGTTFLGLSFSQAAQQHFVHLLWLHPYYPALAVVGEALQAADGDTGRAGLAPLLTVAGRGRGYPSFQDLWKQRQPQRLSHILWRHLLPRGGHSPLAAPGTCVSWILRELF